MDTKKLRQKILDLAIRGKLVPQDPNDEPASVLLDRIRAEKERLIAEGKIKRSKKSKTSDASHYQNFEPPFEIPDSWEWVKMSDISVIARGGSPRPIQQYLTEESDGVNWIKIGDANGKYINSTQQKIKPEGVSRSRLVHKGDFLLTNSMSFGKPYILNIDGCIHDGWLVISPMRNSFDKEFLYYLLSSDFAYYQFSKVAGGAVVSNLNSDKVADTFVPMPPIREQINIVKAIEKWFSILDEIECTKSNLSLLIANAKSKILDLAIAGKLVPQSASDEPAIEALRRINPSFQPCDNPHYQQLPFDIPNNWCWATLGSIAEYGNCISENVSDICPNDWVLELEDIEKDTAKVLQHITRKERNISGIRYRFTSGCVLYSKLRTYLNKVLVATESGYCTTEIIPIRCLQVVLPEYLCMVLRSPYFLAYTAQCGYGVKMPRLSTTDANKGLIPLPCLTEQKRIISVVKSLYEILDTIAAEL
jgi:type I restriction enzyme S subunit